MRMTLLTIFMVSFAFLFLVGIEAKTVKANWAPPEFLFPPSISTISLNCEKTYPSSPNLIFTFNVTHQVSSEGNPNLIFPKIAKLMFRLDNNNESVEFNLQKISEEVSSGPAVGYENKTIWCGNVFLTELESGTHTLYVQVIIDDAVILDRGYGPIVPANLTSLPVSFQVDAYHPNINIIYPQNKTYTTQIVPLEFTVDKSFTWLRYSLDQQHSTSIIGNTTLTCSADGSHEVIIYVNDTVGNLGESDVVFFTVRTQPFPTMTTSLSPLQETASSSPYLTPPSTSSPFQPETPNIPPIASPSQQPIQLQSPRAVEIPTLIIYVAAGITTTAVFISAALFLKRKIKQPRLKTESRSMHNGKSNHKQHSITKSFQFVKHRVHRIIFFKPTPPWLSHRNSGHK